jgi:hypothetical protein
MEDLEVKTFPEFVETNCSSDSPPLCDLFERYINSVPDDTDLESLGIPSWILEKYFFNESVFDRHK